MSAWRIGLVWLGLALGASARTEWAPCSGAIEGEGNLAFPVVWNPSDGLRFRVASPDSNRYVEVRAGESRLEVAFSDDRFQPLSPAARQFRPAGLPSAASTNLPVLIKFRQEQWSVYADGRFVATLSPAMSPPFIVLQPEGDRAQGGRFRFQKVADFRFEDSFMRPEEEGNPLGEWTIESGTWDLHTALETALEFKMVNPESKRLLKSDFSPNFYSLSGRGSNAVLVAGYAFYDHYAYEAGVRTGTGERGLLFALQPSGACHGFTLAMTGDEDAAVVSLWSAADTNRARRTVLASARVRTGPGQWMKLRVKLVQNRIACFLDQAPLFDVQADLPPGGRFGLYADTPAEARFDDVLAESVRDLDFRNVSEVRRYRVEEEGDFFPERNGFLGLFGRAPLAEDALVPAVSEKHQWLALGAAGHAPHVFDTDFNLTGGESRVGLMAGFQGKDRPYVRFVRHRTDVVEKFLLEAVEGDAVRTLEELRVPVKGRPGAERVNLLFDASDPEEWRLYRNDELVLVHAATSGAQGASGLYVGPETRVRIGIPRYRFRREGLFMNRYEKNNRYVEDPFMRHWASPEGQWLEETNKLTWYTGDFFGRFSLRMPLVDPSEIHLGVGEGEATNGEWVVRTGGGALALFRGESTNASVRVPATGLATETNGVPWYKVQSEGRWIWATSGGRLLFKQNLQAPLTGRRIRVAGFTVDQLKSTYVERYNVKDFLFTESLFDWVINGGKWEIVNRFQCDPRWSHMNGEGTNGLAALWTKYRIEGDFCIEMHVGQRHGWYERCGDMNFSVMGSDHTLSKGYTLTCSGWDPDQSQLYSILYKNGKEIARSDKYTVPRRREGNRRLGYEPLVAAGRDVHGAWYYLKFRRVGRTLEFFFDNERVFSVQDDEPLAGGGAGIWTFLNSIMVARVKVAAERITPLPPPLLPPVAAAPAPAAEPADKGGLRKDGRPLALVQPSLWEADDPVGRLRLEWPAAGNRFVARNIMGGGAMAALYEAAPVPLEKAAGWRFEVARSEAARFNFHFSVGRVNDSGFFTPEQRFVYRLSGPSAEKSDWKEAGSALLKPAPAGWNPEGRAGWTPVTVWMPREWPARVPGPGYMVKAEGFGLLHPSAEMAGLFGNGPGEFFAVKDFTEILAAEPKLSLPPQAPVPSLFSVRDDGSGASSGSFTTLTGLQAWAASPGAEGLIAVTVETARPDAGPPAPLAWIRPPALPRVACSWHPGKPEAVLLRSLEAYPDPRFLESPVLVQGVPVTFEREDDLARMAWVPRLDAFTNETLTVAFNGPLTNVFTLRWKDNPLPGRPVLAKLEGVTPFLQNGEPRALATVATAVNPYGVRLEAEDPEQGTFLRVRNTAQGRRLRTPLPVTLSLARHPLFQFRYRTLDEMARVSLSFGGGRMARISEPYAAAVQVRGSTNLFFDGAWRTWRGQVSDALAASDFSKGSFQVSNPEFASQHPVDQTGFYSAWDLDDLVFGPAISRPEQLAFTPSFFSFGGVESVSYCIRQGPESFHELTPAQAKALAWKPVANGQPVTPALAGLTDGECHLFLKAKGRNGKESQVTDVPFLLDRVPLRGTHAFGSPDLTSRRGATLTVVLENDGASPLDTENVRLKWQETEAVGIVKGVSLAHQPAREVISFTWPQLFAEELTRTANGQKVTMVLSGLRDGAGNVSPDVAIPVTLDYAKDKTPPFLTAVQYPPHCTWFTPWEAEGFVNSHFTIRGGPSTVEFVRGTNEPPYLAVKSGLDGSILSRLEKVWEVEKFPFLAFRIRRPVNPTNDTAALTFSIDFSNSQGLTVPLTARKPSPRYTMPADPLVWKSNEWTSVFLDLAAGCRERGITNMAGVSIRSMSLRATGTDPSGRFDIQNFFAYAAAKSNAMPRLEVFDSSGMAPHRIEWEAGGTDKGFVRGWQVIYPFDRAGNRGLPVRVPLAAPPALMTKEKASMASRVKVPKLTENADEVTITGWLKKEGDAVAKGEPLVEMTTDKAAFEVEAPGSGRLLRILAPEKSVLPTGYVVAFIGTPGEALPDVAAANARLLEGRAGKPKAAPAAPAAPAARPAAAAPEPVPAPAGEAGPVRATPAARRLAREKGVDLARVKAENRAEVVTEEMVRKFAP